MDEKLLDRLAQVRELLEWHNNGNGRQIVPGADGDAEGDEELSTNSEENIEETSNRDDPSKRRSCSPATAGRAKG